MLLLALLIGFIAGLRSMTAPALVSWGAALGAIPLEGSFLAFLAHPVTPWFLTLLALGELVVDKLPQTPSRLLLLPFLVRLVVGGVCGGIVGGVGGVFIGGALAGIIGAGLGSFGGAAFRERMSEKVKMDLPGAVLEDLVAVGGALLVVLALG